MKKLMFFLIIGTCLTKVSVGQKAFNNWFFGSKAALSFNSGSPTFVPGSNMISAEGCSSVSDSRGNLLFYSNGVNVWNRNHAIMPNGSGLNGDAGSSQSVLITNHPGNPNLYYVFTTPKDGDPVGMQYSIVNMSLNGGLGDVDPAFGKNISFNLPVCEKLAAIRHRNGNSIWLIARRYESTQFVEYLIDCTGLHAFPAFFNAAANIDRPDNAGGYLKASPDGTKLAAANFHGDIDLFDFDNNSGAINNARVIFANPGFQCGPYGLEFSPDSKLLYSSQAFSCNTPATYEISQYQLDAPNITASKTILETGVNNVAGALQLGPDNRIYIAYDQSAFLGTINNPNIVGAGCALVKQSFALPAPALSGMGLPNVSTGYTGYNRSLLGDDTVLCDQGSLTLQVNIPNTTYLWSDNSTGNSLMVNSSGKYWLTINNGGCIYSDTINIIFQASPKFSLGNDTAVCLNKFPFSLQQSIPGATYLWQDSTTASSVSVTKPGTYWLQASLSNCKLRDSVEVTGLAIPQFNLGRDTIVCGGAGLTLTANTTATSFLWSTGATSASIQPTITGTYWCQATNSGGCSFRDTITVTVRQAPVVNLGNDTLLCPDKFPYRIGQAITGATYLWQDGTTTATYQAAAAGLYWQQATLNGCSTRDTILLSAATVDTFNLGRDTIICGSQALTLRVGPAALSKYLWSTGATTQSIAVNSSGIYWCEATNGTGCTFRDSIKITYNTAPVVNLGKDTLLCPDRFPLKLTVNVAGAAYLWQDGSTVATFSAPGPGVYWVQATVNGCSSRDSITISAALVNAFSLGADTIICGNGAVNLSAPAGYVKYLWSTGSSAMSIQVISSGVYWCEAVNSDGCSFRDSIRISYNPASIVNLGKDTAICQDKLPMTIGQRITNAVYLWQDGSTNALFTVNAPGLYWVQATINGCSARDSITITVGAPTAFSLGPDTAACANQAITLSANQTFTRYLWSTGATTASVAARTTGIYWLETTNDFGCSYRDSVIVSFRAAPVVNLGKDSSVCVNNLPITLSQNIPGATYLWQDGSTRSFYSVAAAGLYWLQADVNGCSARDTIIISTDNSTAFSLGADTVVCNRQPISLGVTGTFGRYLWSTGSNSKTISVNSSGDYWLEAGNTGCSYRDTVHVEFRSPPVFTLGADTVVCNVTSYLLNVGNTPGTYLWQDNSTKPTFLVTKSGNYQVFVNSQGCISSDTVSVGFRSKPVPDLGPDKTICPGESLTLSTTVPEQEYLWQDGSRASTFTVTATGAYKVSVTNECGTGSDEVLVSTGTCALTIPNAFTPGKRTNNIFRLVNAFGLKEFSLQVFNRWGQQVFSTKDSSSGWDGRYNGNDQPSGIYVYIVSYDDPVRGRFSQKGSVALIR